MKQTKQFLRPLLMAIVMLVGMLVPQGAWAQELWVDYGETVTISEDASYDGIDVDSGGELIINEGVTLTVTVWLNINGYDIDNLYGTVINYGTIIGEGQINMQGGVLANHGHIDLSGAMGNGTFYNTGTHGDNYFYLDHTVCNHDDSEDLYEVDATCTHGAGTQVKCNTCHYIGIKETGEPLPHDNYDHNGLTVCSTCGQLTFDATPIGEGTAERPYQIANAGHLFWFADKVNNDYENFKEANAVLTADIVVNDGTFADDGTFTATGASEPSTPIEWLIIGRFDIYSLGYRGTFDGQGHTISGLYANYIYSGFVGMSAGEGKIKNVGVINSYFDGNRAGGICGRAFNNTEISNCYSSNVICKGYYVGGIVGGSSSSDVSIINCYSTASLINQSGIDIQAGGIAGTMNGSTTNCYTSYGNVNGWCETEINCEANVTLERFASGEIAYKLNGSVDGEGNWTAGATDGTQKWYQKLGEDGDSYPVLAAAEGNTNTVYEQKIFNCGEVLLETKYYNTEEEDIIPNHDFTKGKCTVCGYECEHDWEVYDEHVHECTICFHQAEHDWSNKDGKCAVCGYVCQHKDEDDEVWENGVCTVCDYVCQHDWESDDFGHGCTICDIDDVDHDWSNEDGKCSVCGYVCQHDYERGEGNEGDNFHVCTICQYVDDCTFEDGICTGCGYVCEHKTGGYKDEHAHLCSACELSLSHIIDEEHLYYSVYTEDGDCVNIYRGAGGNEISVQNYDELESLKFKVYSLCKVCSNGDPNFKVYPEDFFAEANYNDINCSEASLDVIIYKRVDNGADAVAYYELKVSISNPSHKWENGVCSRCDAECEHDFTSKTLTEEPDADGLYAYVCDRGCGAHSDDHIVKGDSNGNIFALTATTDGETTTYTAEAPVTLTDAGGFASPVPFTAASITYERPLASGKWGTLCLPYALSAKDGYEYFTLSNVSSDAVTLSKIEGTVAAGTPVLVRHSDSGNLSLTETNVQVGISTNPAGAIEGLQLQGTFVPKDVTAGYYLDATDNMLHSIETYCSEKPATSLTIPAFRAWFASSTPAGAPLRININDDEATAIAAISALTEGKAEIYDMNGRRIQSLQKGVNIMKYGNGKSIKVNIK